jgi:acyl carrier protein
MELIQQKLHTFVTDNFLFGQDAGRLSEDDSLIEMGVIDSTGVLQLVAFLEEEFKIRVEDNEVTPQNLDSLRRLAEFVQRKLASVDEDVKLESCADAA